ncbi:GEVED domain-containing protein, partial [Aurantibacter sp.]|uniref:GEVED domain-containing protein n=1 Tax=Aurantibacter sp. TaxID=2807103 RepID=UPI0035C85F87
CDDDSGTGTMPTLVLTGTPGATVTIRFWEYGSNNDGTFGICAWDPNPSTPCVTPTTQPTALTFSGVTTTQIDGSFTAAGAPGADNYLVVMNTTNVAPTLVDGTTYNPGDAIAGGNTVIDNDANTTFTAAGLTDSTTYYFFVFSYNNTACSGGPLYNTTGPLNNSQATVTPTPCVTPATQPTALTFGTVTGSTIAATFTAAVPAVDNYLVVYNTTNVAPTLTNGTSYNPGDTIGASTVVDNDADTSFLASGLTSTTTYYFFVFAFNDSTCAGGPLYNTTAPLNGTETTVAFTYCEPSNTENRFYINDFSTVGNVTDITNLNTGYTGTGYTDYTAQVVTNLQGATVNFVADFGQANNTFGASIWVDFNSDSTFDPGEQVYTSGAYVGGVTASFIIPPATPAGSYRMRLLIDWLDTTPDPCLFSADRGEAEDYTLTVTSPAPCTTPIAQPTALSFDSVTASAITASFTAAAPAADNYLVVMNTTGVAPTIVDGTTYLVGDTIGTSTVIDTDSDTIFTATPLLPTTTYFFFIYSYNNLICSGGPLYNTVLPLLGNTITPVASAYCEGEATVDESVKYINDLEFIGTLNDVSNFGNGFTGGATPGYQDWTGLTNSIQAQGEGINVFVEGEIGRGHIKAWVDWDRNGAFDFVTEEVYDSEGIATTSTTFGFVIPPAQAIGDYRIRIRYYNSFRNSDGAEYAAYDFDACEDFGPQVHFGFNFTEYGETEDYLFTVISSCDATIDNIVEPSICGDGTANLAATGSASTIEYHWYANEGDTVPIVTTNVGNWTTPVLTTSTDYYVTADNGTCESLVKTKISVRVNPVAVLTFTPSTPEVCGEDDIIAISAAGTNEIAYLIEEDFETGTLGTLVVNNLRTYTAAETAITQWQPRTSTFVPAEAVWFPAISSGFGTNNFAMANSDSSTTNITETAIESGVLDSSTFTDLTLDFDMYFSRYVFGAGIPENVNVEVSTNGGGAWTTLQTYDNDIGYGTAFASQTIDLSAYVNETNLKVRIRYFADYWCDGVAIDNVELYGSRPLNSSFSWTSPTPIDAYTDPAATIPYTTGTTVGIVYVKPTAVQLEQNSFEFVATATMNNGCEISANIAITNNTKFWKGTTDTEWNDPTNWAPAGVPTIDNCVIIPDNTEITGTGYDAYARNLTVRPTGVLDLQSENNLTVQEFVTVDAGGTFDIRDSASLIQIDNDANTGTVTIERNSQAMNALDYTFWSSPITAYTLGGLVPGSLYYLSYTPTIANGHGNWNYLNAGDSMAPGTGYAIRSTGTGVHNGSFVGTPTNGDVNTAITIGTDATLGLTIGDTTVGPNDDQWQLIGNPYASAIDITTFLNHPTNSPILDGTAYLWTHNTAPTAGTPDPFYADYVANYTLNDYASINSLGGTTTAMSGGTTPIAYIASGQSFVVLGTGNGTAIFDNTMRGSNNNNTFFKTAEQQNSKSITPDFEKHRVWFNLSSDYGGFSQVLLGYAEGATNGWDRGLDAINYGGNSVTFYFVTPDIEMKTQAKPLPFADTDIVPLGYKAVNQGQLRIGIDHFDDLFDTIDIYVRDKDLDVEHNLKLAPYIFTTEVGVFNDRFEIIYRSNALSTTDFDSVNNNVLVFSNGDLTIKSNNFDIKNVQVFNTLGQKLFNLNNINKTLVSLNGFRKTETMLLITIELSNGATLTKKVIH